MREGTVRALGFAAAVVYAAVIVSIYVRQPETLAELRGGLAATVGAYTVNEPAFREGLERFHADRFEEARAAFERADPARRDARTQFYVAYSFYRQGWHRLYSDDRLFAEGLKAAERAVALDSQGAMVVEDERLQMRTARELKAELEAGLRRDPSDLNPLRLFRGRK